MEPLEIFRVLALHFVRGALRSDVLTSCEATGHGKNRVRTTRWTWMIEALFTLLFGCWHRRTSWPITRKRDQKQPPGESQARTYVVCLDCGKEFSYDWTRMQVVEPTRQEGTPQNMVPAVDLNDRAGKVGLKGILRWNECLARGVYGLRKLRRRQSDRIEAVSHR